METIFISFSRIYKKYHDIILEKSYKILEKKFINRVVSYSKWENIQASFLGRLMVKMELKRLFDINNTIIQNSIYGKPSIDNPISFNISHSENIVVIAISECFTIGIDIERVRPIDFDSYENQFTRNEWKNIRASKNINKAFYHKWTQKEAVVKAIGKGICLPLNSFDIIDNRFAKVENENWFLKTIDLVDNYYCHVAFNSDSQTVRIATQEINFKAFLKVNLSG